MSHPTRDLFRSRADEAAAMADGTSQIVEGSTSARAAQPDPEAEAEGSLHDLELFAGAGGLCLGLRASGIMIDRLFERNPRACDTLRRNQRAGAGVTGTVIQADVRDVDWSAVGGTVRLLAAGPPCQPFSLAGSHAGDQDQRNEFPATLAAVRSLAPAVVLIENVQGLTRPSFRPYFQYILRQLAFPSIEPGVGSDWTAHHRRLQAHEARHEPEYHVRWASLNAADFGVAQLRKRTVIVASRAGYPVVELPRPTHSAEALIADQRSGAYWRRHDVKAPEGSQVAEEQLALDTGLLPWRTVRDAIRDLREPGQGDDDPLQHFIVPGARVYRGHLGSSLDWPSKTIKAGVHGVAGGENIIHLDDGTFRYFTLREMARVQGFPDDYVFDGPRSRVIGQIGNAVPCGLAEAVGHQIAMMFASVPTLATKRAPTGPETDAPRRAG